MQPSTPKSSAGDVLQLLQPAQGAVDLVLGVLANAAGVKQDGVGLARTLDQLVAGFQQARRPTNSLSSTFIWQPTVWM